MKLFDTLRPSLNLLDSSGKKKLLALVAAQFCISLLDVFGVALLAYVATTGLKSSVFPNGAGSGGSIFTSRTPEPVLADFSKFSPILILSIGVILFLIKNVVSLILLRSTYLFLANKAAAISETMMLDFFRRDLTFLQSQNSQSAAIGLTQGLGFLIIDVLGSFIVLFSEIVMLIFLGSFMIYLFPVETIFSIIFFGIAFLFMQRFVLEVASKAGYQKTFYDLKSLQLINGVYDLFREIVLGDRLEYFHREFKNQRESSSRAAMNGQFVGYLPKYLLEVALILGTVLLSIFEYFLGGWEMVLAVISTFFIASSRFLPSLLRTQGALTTIRFSGSAGHTAISLLESLNTYPRIALTNSQIHSALKNYSQSPTGKIEINDLTFTYPGASSPAISNFTAVISPGERIAIVGPSGAGKSTAADLIAGMHHVDSGMILIDGVPTELAIQIWPRCISYVSQSPTMLNSSILQNITLGKELSKSDETEIEKIIQITKLDNFIDSLPNKLASIIGENGFNISGGQLQRVAIARALFSKPTILILDEATSSLDAESENLIVNMIRSLPQNITVVTIAHRLSTVQFVDRIFYFESGRCLASGSFSDVKRLHPNFALQAKLLGL